MEEGEGGSGVRACGAMDLLGADGIQNVFSRINLAEMFCEFFLCFFFLKVFLLLLCFVMFLRFFKFANIFERSIISILFLKIYTYIYIYIFNFSIVTI